MAKTNKEYKKYLGYILFKLTGENDENLEIIKIIRINKFNNKIIIRNQETKKASELHFDYLNRENYEALKPYGHIGFSVVKMYTNQEKTEYNLDVIVTLYRDIDLEISGGKIPPYAICRQGIYDFFYDSISKKEYHDFVGVSVTRDNCPPNIPYDTIAACDEVIRYDLIAIYRNTTLDDILDCIKTKYYDDILDSMFKKHCEQLGAKGTIIYNTRDEHNGWCKTLRKLLEINNFMFDYNTMCEITEVEFDIKSYLIDDDYGRFRLNDEMIMFISKLVKQNIKELYAIKYWYDINLSDFNNTSHILLKDSNGDIYIIVYTTEGKYLETDLEEEELKLDISDKLRLAFYDKYSE